MQKESIWRKPITLRGLGIDKLLQTFRNIFQRIAASIRSKVVVSTTTVGLLLLSLLLFAFIYFMFSTPAERLELRGKPGEIYTGLRSFLHGKECVEYEMRTTPCTTEHYIIGLPSPCGPTLGRCMKCIEHILWFRWSVPEGRGCY